LGSFKLEKKPSDESTADVTEEKKEQAPIKKSIDVKTGKATNLRSRIKSYQN
jgi:hypothetical protein